METTVWRYPLLEESLKQAPIIRKGDYGYFVHPLSDGVPRVEPAVLKEATAGLAAHLAPFLDEVDVLLTAEAMGLPLAAAVSLATDRPFLTARKRPYGLPGERVVEQTTGYGSSRLYINGLRPGDRVAVLDDVISTGGTLRALAAGLREAGARLRVVVAVFSKEPQLRPMAEALGCPVSALVSCRVVTEAGTDRVEIVAHDVRA